MSFTPGGRKARQSLQPFLGGVPEVASAALRDWCAERFNNDVERFSLLNVEFSWRLATPSIFTVEDMTERVVLQVSSNEDDFLELIEYLVDNMSGALAHAGLEKILSAAHSIYQIKDGQLTYRVDPAVQAQAEQAIADADQGAAHWLTEAWNDAYARTPRPGTSYEASIRAVEAAYRAIVIPDNGRGTVTQVINALRDGKSKFAFELVDARGDAAGKNEPIIDALDTVLAMLRTLAYGQKTRHGDSGPVTINSDEEARAAVQLAVTLVQFATSGAFRQK